ncbi:histidine phosphatase family protein [Aureimonas flava]|uniref:Histidine phosphatase family protein n=1 Tax=Aureimonas flava TaxID=2320271 RepID=A0A3A1WFA9_9HYPH|nr:histidine phosphatase family protein [Aureimonas flava]RIX98479.1 histidine phosphatase family protein [Aureimonas flava]
MASLLFVSHPEVVVDPQIPVERWHLSAPGVERMRAFAHAPGCARIGAVWASTETKAIEAAGILAGARGLGGRVARDLGENDRSATGYLAPAEFEAMADAFFAQPAASVRGWERALDAQARILRAVRAIAAEHGDGDLAVVSHGAVGTLLLCALQGRDIARASDQPFQGHVWTASLPDLVPRTSWRPIAPRIGA